MDLFTKCTSLINLLEADSIWLQYGDFKLLQNIYIRVEVGQITGLLGRNGCGKSSLLEVLYGIKSAQTSSVRINGKYIKKPYRHKNLLAYLPQKNFVPHHLKVEQAFKLYESTLPQAKQYFPELTEWLPHRFKQFSGGQQRLIETIMVMSSVAPFILLDEPFLNVMPLHVETLKTWLTSLKSNKGILITDHSYQDVLAVSDTVYLLNMGGRTIALTQPQMQLKDLGYLS